MPSPNHRDRLAKPGYSPTVQLVDAYGLETTSGSVAAVERLDWLVDGFVTFAVDAPERLREAVSGDAPPLAHIALGYMLIQAHTAADHLRATEAARRVADADLNERERMHLEALTAWLAGDLDLTTDIWDSLLLRWPTDMLALRLQHFRLFNRGRLDAMLNSVRRSIDAWGDAPRRTYLSGMEAFAHEELGNYDTAERLGRAATEADPADLWSVHSVAHVLEMQGRAEDGLDWFDGRADVLHSSGSFARHLWWHHAIIYLRTESYDRMLELYDTEIQPADATDGLSLTNAIDLLARLEYAGVDVGDRWDPLLDGASARLGYHDQPFNDAHYAYALARAGDAASAARLLDGMAAWQDRSGTAAEVITEVGLDTATAMVALGFGRTAEAKDLLAQGQSERWKLGGSHAQRRVFDLAQQI